MAVTIDGVGTVNGVTLPTTGFGKVLQVVRATDATTRSTTSTSYVDASISVTITPQKSTSAVLLIWAGQVSEPAGNLAINFQITDSSNNAISGAENGLVYSSNATSTIAISTSLIGYATPGTTSAVTYKLRFKVNGGTGSLDNATQTGQIYAIEVSA